MITDIQSPILDTAIHCVCESFGVEKGQLLGKTRLRHVVDARHAYCALVVHEYNERRKKHWQNGISVAQIGGAINRDHSTVLYSAHKSHALRMAWDDYRIYYVHAQEMFLKLVKPGTDEDRMAELLERRMEIEKQIEELEQL